MRDLRAFVYLCHGIGAVLLIALFPAATDSFIPCSYCLTSSGEHFPTRISQRLNRKKMAYSAGVLSVKRQFTEVGARWKEPTEDSEASRYEWGVVTTIELTQELELPQKPVVTGGCEMDFGLLGHLGPWAGSVSSHSPMSSSTSTQKSQCRLFLSERNRVGNHLSCSRWSPMSSAYQEIPN